MLPTISMEPSYVIEEDDQMIRNALIDMLVQQNSTDRLMLPNLFPKFLKVNEERPPTSLTGIGSISIHFTQFTGEKHRQRIENYSGTDERHTERRQWVDLHRGKCFPKHIAANAFNTIRFDYMVGSVRGLRWSHLQRFIRKIAARRLCSQFGVVHIQWQIVPGNVEHFHGRRVSGCYATILGRRFSMFLIWCDSASSASTQRSCSSHREFSDPCSPEAVRTSCSRNCPMLIEYFSCV